MSDVYGPEVIPDVPFPLPQNGDVSNLASAPASGDIIHPATIQQQPFPRKIIAHETIGSALNTRAKKILSDFQFAKNGAIAIGEYEPGVSGDIQLTPKGITARDISGNPTFDLDADTGDAVFRGEVQAADFVVIDDFGLVSLANFHSGNLSTFYYRSTNSVDPVLLADTTLTFTLTRAANVLILITFLYYMDGIISGYSPEANIYFRLDGVDYQTIAFLVDTRQGADAAAFYQNFSREYSGAYQVILPLAAGNHSIAMSSQIDSGGAAKIWVGNTSVSYVVLGT